ncbi:hypothetical protein NDU88_007307, partial [Pleurodeles waltl]
IFLAKFKGLLRILGKKTLGDPHKSHLPGLLRVSSFLNCLGLVGFPVWLLSPGPKTQVPPP